MEVINNTLLDDILKRTISTCIYIFWLMYVKFCSIYLKSMCLNSAGYRHSDFPGDSILITYSEITFYSNDLWTKTQYFWIIFLYKYIQTPKEHGYLFENPYFYFFVHFFLYFFVVMTVIFGDIYGQYNG